MIFNIIFSTSYHLHAMRVHTNTAQIPELKHAQQYGDHHLLHQFVYLFRIICAFHVVCFGQRPSNSYFEHTSGHQTKQAQHYRIYEKRGLSQTSLRFVSTDPIRCASHHALAPLSISMRSLLRLVQFGHGLSMPQASHVQAQLVVAERFNFNKALRTLLKSIIQLSTSVSVLVNTQSRP